MPADVNSFLVQLSESGLLDAEQLQQLLGLPEARRTDPRPLARVVLQRGWLTHYQVNQVVAGRARELFVGPYLLLERLGAGGMGQVFRARHLHMDREVALKVIRKEKLASANAVQRFYAEVRTAAQLSHPNIVLAHDAGEAGGTHFLAMEYVDGVNLARLVKEQGALPVGRVCDYIRQAALGLAHAHDKGLVHRDIKPHNLLLTRQGGLVKVLGMGLARLQGGLDRGRALTQTGAVIGTPDYLAPEQAIDSKQADARSDLYGLGCTLYFLLAGHPPFIAESLTQLLSGHQVEATPLSQLRGDVPAGVAAVVRRLMARRPEDRYQSAAELAAVLEGPASRRDTDPTPLVPLLVDESASADNLWNSIQEEPPPSGSRSGRRRAELEDLSQSDVPVVRSPRRRKRSTRGRSGAGRKKVLLWAGLAGVPLLGLFLTILALASSRKDGLSSVGLPTLLVNNDGPGKQRDDDKRPGERQKEPEPQLPLIHNGDFSQGTEEFYTGYTHSQMNVGRALSFSITNNPHSVHALGRPFGDHTSGNGLMMVINGGNAVDAVVWGQKVAVAPGRGYCFSFWVTSWFSWNPAQLEVRINGKAVGKIEASSRCGEWKEFKVTWNSGNNRLAVIELFNLRRDLGGNDFAIDDLSLIPQN
jgi:eukaryotic-like serine/threonine-protein kinase